MTRLRHFHPVTGQAVVMAHDPHPINP